MRTPVFFEGYCGYAPCCINFRSPVHKFYISKTETFALANGRISARFAYKGGVCGWRKNFLVLLRDGRKRREGVD